jgi:dTDP-3-amino-3,4,6-trideoxy-alpha-D-glucose transaminase
VTVSYLDLHAAVEELRPETDEAIRNVLDSGRYILDSEVEAFEREFAAFCGVRHCIGVGNGLDAIQLLLRALGIGPGDEVVVPAYTAVATWMAVTLVGATPVGADVHGETWNVDPESVAAAVTPRTKAVIAVHLFGQPAEMEPLVELTEQRGLALIEDAAQAHGARHQGRRVGGLARGAAFSFYPTKNLGALGDGGAVTTDDAELADTVRRLRAYGWRERDMSELKGINSRLDELQAAILRVRLRHLERWNRRRAEIAAIYLAAFEDRVVTPVVPPWADPVWHLFVIATDARQRLRDELAGRGIGTLVHYFPLPHLTPAYRADGWEEGRLPTAERLAETSVSLPLYPQLGDGACHEVIEAVLASRARSTV